MAAAGWGGAHAIVGWGCWLTGSAWTTVASLTGGMVTCLSTAGGGGFTLGWGGSARGGGGSEGGWGCNMVVWVAAGLVWFWTAVLGRSFAGLYQFMQEATVSRTVPRADIARFFLFNKLSLSASLFIALIVCLLGLAVSLPWAYLYDVVLTPSKEDGGLLTYIWGTFWEVLKSFRYVDSKGRWVLWMYSRSGIHVMKSCLKL